MSFSPIQVTLDAQHYAAIRVQARQSESRDIVPVLLAEVHDWLTSHRIPTTGPALIRYLAIDFTTGAMDIQVGFPIAASTPTHQRVEFATQPAGTYLIAVHRGSYDSLPKTTDLLLGWAKDHAVKLMAHENGNQEEWTARFEHYLVGPATENNPRHWHTEIAILRAPVLRVSP
jgi:effector-binding domain-containing protein